MWKSRFRCLLHPIPVEHELSTKIIYATAILHNMLVVHAKDKIQVDVSGCPKWAHFFEHYKSHRCPNCVRSNLPHCIHQAVYRNGPQKSARVTASALRDTMCAQMWDTVCAGPNRAAVEAEMRARVDELA